MNRYFIKTTFAKILLLIFAAILTAKEPIRTWTSTDGRTIKARYLEIVGTKVRIENASGRKFTVPLTGFSSADQEYVKLAYGRSLFAVPQSFDDDGRGGVIVASANGGVEVLVPSRDSYSEAKPRARAVIVGESIGPGTTLITGSGASADLLLTNGTLAHLGENTKLILSALYQKSFKGTNQKVIELTQEVSPSRTALKLEEGDLVLDVRKLSKESSFLISTKMAQAGIRGTQFKLSANADSAELSVLEGRVDFLDAEQLATQVETAKKAGARKGVPAKLEDMSTSEQAEVKQAVEQAKGASALIDLNRLANTVDGYSPKPNYLVKSALNMELIWCPPGGYFKGVGKGEKIVLKRGFYLGKFEVTQEQYEKLMGENPSRFKGKKLPIESISWFAALKYCKILTERERKKGWVFSLPTEVQWEYACRAGTSTTYSWGNSVSPKLANYSESNLKRTEEIGSYRSNPWGFYDMHGNLLEWCLDKFGASNRVVKGGAWWSSSTGISSASKGNYGANSRHISSGVIGFRVVLKQVD